MKIQNLISTIKMKLNLWQLDKIRLRIWEVKSLCSFGDTHTKWQFCFVWLSIFALLTSSWFDSSKKSCTPTEVIQAILLFSSLKLNPLLLHHHSWRFIFKTTICLIGNKCRIACKGNRKMATLWIFAWPPMLFCFSITITFFEFLIRRCLLQKVCNNFVFWLKSTGRKLSFTPHGRS